MPKKSDIFINRELSWLEFNRRVMDLSHEKWIPLGEKLNFAAIYGSNLDEFFMVRVGSLHDQTLLHDEKRENKTQMTPQAQLDAIMQKVEILQRQCDKNISKLFRALARQGLQKVDFRLLEKGRLNFWKKYFQRELLPVLSPQIVDRRHPFPFLRNMEIYVGLLLKDKKTDVPVFALIPVHMQLERLVLVQDEEEGLFCYALVEELILQFAHLAFGKSQVLEKCLFRVTRNADINVEEGMFDYDIDLREVMSELLRKRRKLAAVRLQFYEKAPELIKEHLLQKLDLPQNQAMVQRSPLDLSFLRVLIKRLEKKGDQKLFYPPVRHIPQHEGYNLYRDIQQHDVLVCYPYQSMRPFISMLFQAARDPMVVSIKMTLYRVANDSKVIEALIAAAENGKEVVTVVELRARFDEQNNIDWSRRLEQAGCTVIYGFTDYKVHSKITLITRRTEAGFEYITQIGTGNYNEKTSELYADIAYYTANLQIGEEVAGVFNDLAVEQLTEQVNHLIVAPKCFKSVLLREVEEEIRHHQQGGEARIIVKCNSVSDKRVIETLSKASQAGVRVDMIIRGICCLQTGVQGFSDNIHVISIVGRYLEHTRIFSFGAGERLRIYIASGDFLTRNTERRVEVGVRIDDAAVKETLRDILEMQLADNHNARRMQPDGSYLFVQRANGARMVDSQMAMYPYLQARTQRLYRQEEPPSAPPPKEETTAITMPPASAVRRAWRRISRLFKK